MAETINNRLEKADSVGINPVPKTSNPFTGQFESETKLISAESVGQNPVPATQSPFKGNLESQESKKS